MPRQPFASLTPAPPLAFPNEADSNSPVVWDRVNGRPVLYVLNSVAGGAALSAGPGLQRLFDLREVSFSTAAPLGGFWFESVVPDTDTWYGYYHNELADVVCPGSGKVVPRIGAARSRDRGRTWEDLGPILEAPMATMRCRTRNHYFVGGVGDFSAILDADRQYLYLFYTQYLEQDGWVGVSVARMAWADRDEPAGTVTVWNQGAWLPARYEGWADDDSGEVLFGTWWYPFGTPVHPAADRWDNASPSVDVLWGPSVHWNTHLESYVMLLNRAVTTDWKPGGIYISFNPRLDDPAGWSPPALLLAGGAWYPQVVGLEAFAGTDRLAGETARFYMSGRSNYLIRFGRR